VPSDYDIMSLVLQVSPLSIKLREKTAEDFLFLQTIRHLEMGRMLGLRVQAIRGPILYHMFVLRPAQDVMIDNEFIGRGGGAEASDTLTLTESTQVAYSKRRNFERNDVRPLP
jgi:hypothetical protein